VAKKKRKREPAPAVPRGTSVNALGVTVAVLLLAGLAGAVAYVGRMPREAANVASPAEETTDLERWQAAPVRQIALGSAYALGPENAPVTIVEFSDFQCPFCRQAAGYLSDLKERYGEKLRLVFKDYPLDTACNPHIGAQTHSVACKAAAMARCAGEEGRFWEMHDAIFALPDLTDQSLDALSSTLGIDACENEKEIVARIQADVEEGRKLGVSATPTIFVNGREALNREDGIRTIIDHLLSTP
jgi:protein-disulfide isomerase